MKITVAAILEYQLPTERNRIIRGAPPGFHRRGRVVKDFSVKLVAAVKSSCVDSSGTLRTLLIAATNFSRIDPLCWQLLILAELTHCVGSY